MLLVAALHVGAGVLITQGLDLDLGPSTQPPVITATVEPRVEPPVIVEHVPVTPRSVIVDEWIPQDADFDEERRDADAAIPAVIDEAPSTGSGAGSGADVGLPPQLVAVKVDSRYPLTQPPYPAASIRMNEEGTGVVSVYVLPNGRVGEARIERSTGSSRLDEAALAEAKRWRLRAATRDGVAFAEWYSVRVVFRLDRR
jgi:protein TonB